MVLNGSRRVLARVRSGWWSPWLVLAVAWSAPAVAQTSPFTGQPAPTQPQQVQVPPPPPPSAAPGPVVEAPARPAPFVEASTKPPRAVPLSVFRLGYGAYGAGSVDFRGQCVGSCPISLRNDSESVSDRTRALLGFDLMFGPEPLSLGFGFWFTTGTTLENAEREPSKLRIGWELATPFMLGAAVPVTEAIAIRAGAFGGPELLFADRRSAQGRDGEAYDNLCDDLGDQVRDCDTSFPTRLAWTYGFHVGPVFRTSRLSTLGAELMLQRVDFELFDLVAEGSSWRAQQVYDYSAWRLWIMLNVGLGK